VQPFPRGRVHDLFQEQGPHGGEQGGGLASRFAGAGQAVEGEAVEKGQELVQMYQIPDTGGIPMHGRLGFRDLAATGLALLLLGAGVTVGIGGASAGPSAPGWGGSSADLAEPNDDPFLAVTGAPLAVGYLASRIAGVDVPATCP
jgi:hypothetical protein